MGHETLKDVTLKAYVGVHSPNISPSPSPVPFPLFHFPFFSSFSSRQFCQVGDGAVRQRILSSPVVPIPEPTDPDGYINGPYVIVKETESLGQFQKIRSIVELTAVFVVVVVVMFRGRR